MTEKKFQIYQRQYDIIIQQAVDNLPHECGGFVGGKDKLITAIMPTFNRHIGDTRESFGITSEDIMRAHEFFAKHKLKFFGIYHTHPSGVAIPSHQDLKNNQRHLFIIGLSCKEDHEFAIWECHGFNTEKIPLEVLPDDGMTVIDVRTGEAATRSNDLFQEAAELSRLVHDMKTRQLKYPKMSPRDPFNDTTGFTTIA